MPSGLRGESGNLSIIYTSVRLSTEAAWHLALVLISDSYQVSSLPIKYRNPYVRGSETLAIATSRDHGRTWQRIAQDPILPGPPRGVDVTGWRDPHIEPNSRIDSALGYAPGRHLYGVISGGIRDKGPTVWVYAVPRDNLTRWTYLGPLVDPQTYFPSPWSPDLGINWEVCNLFDVEDETVLLISSEGTNRTEPSQRDFGLSMWMIGPLKARSNGQSVDMKPSTVGTLDAGAAYAFNSFDDPVKRRRIVWGESLVQRILRSLS